MRACGAFDRGSNPRRGVPKHISKRDTYNDFMALKFEEAPEIKRKVSEIVMGLGLKHIDLSMVSCYRSRGSKTRAYARIWEFPRILQLAINHPPHYVIEVISPKFDKLSEEEKEKVLIHELFHIPTNFSGSLRPHGDKVAKYLDKKIDALHDRLKSNRFIREKYW